MHWLFPWFNRKIERNAWLVTPFATLIWPRKWDCWYCSGENCNFLHLIPLIFEFLVSWILITLIAKRFSKFVPTQQQYKHTSFILSFEFFCAQITKTNDTTMSTKRMHNYVFHPCTWIIQFSPPQVRPVELSTQTSQFCVTLYGQET